MQSFDFKKLLPHLLIIVGFAILAALYNMPQLDGLVLNQTDIVHWKGMSHEGKEFHEKTGEQVLWSNSMFGGMPTYTSYVAKSNNYLSIQNDLVLGLFGKPIGFFFIAMLFFYLFTISLNINKWVGAIGAVIYAFSTYNAVIISAGHETKMWSLAYMPGVIGSLLFLYDRKWWKGILLMIFSLPTMFSNSHYQIVYYTIIIIFFLVIGVFVIAIRKKQVKEFFISSAVALLVAALCIGPSMQGLLSTLEYNKATMRGGQSELTFNHDKEKKSGGLDKDYAFGWSNSIGETICLIVPKFYGGSSMEEVGTSSNTYETLTGIGVPESSAEQFVQNVPLYWGDQQFLLGPVYFGAIVCFLFVLGLMLVRSPHKWWIVAVSVLAIVMSWGKNFPGFNYFLFDTLPGLNKFRIPTMILIIPEFLFPVLGVWVLNDIIKEKYTAEELWKNTKVALIATAGFCILIGFGSSMFFDFKSVSDAGTMQRYVQMLGGNEQAGRQLMNAIQADRIDIARNSALMSAFYILLAGGLIWAFSRKKINGTILLVGIGIIAAIDLISVDKGYLNENNFVEAADDASFFPMRQVDQQILQDPDPYYRVLDVTRSTFLDATTSYYHKTIGGQSPAKMEIYQDLIDVHMTGKFNSAVLNMLNTKYIIFQGGPNGQEAVMKNPDACGNAWFVNNINWANTADEEILGLNAGSLGDTATIPNAFQPLSTAVVRNTFKKDLEGYTFGKDSAAFVRLSKYGLNTISFTSSNAQNGFAVFSDIYYPYGWKAYIDGKETPIIRANYVLRALKIPAGQHEIKFEFHPSSFYTGDNIALITSFILFGLIIISLVMLMKKNKKEAGNA
jgi:hypothetical protein